MQLYPDIKTKFHAHLIGFVTPIQSVPLLNMFFLLYLYINNFTDSVACDSIQHGV